MSQLQYFNRYSNFLINGQQTIVPYITLPSKSTDKNYIYKVGQSRLDKISQQYYDSPFFGWLILQANEEYGGLEWNIPDNSIIVIPYPLVSSLQDYNSQDKYFSSKLVQPVVGWAMSLGYKTNIKPDNQIATKAADHHCR